MIDNRISELQTELEAIKKEMAFYKRLATESGQQQLRETEGLSTLISEMNKTQKALKESERRMSDIIDFLPDATFVIDRAGKVTAWNQAIENMTGVRAEDMVGKGNYEYAIPFYGDRRPVLINLTLLPQEDFLQVHYEDIEKGNTFLSGEVFAPCINQGKGANLWVNASMLYDENGDVIGAVESIRDITERKTAEQKRQELEERLQRAEKMEALGLLSGGVAHDLNNVLGVLLGYSELLLFDVDNTNIAKDHVIAIRDAAQRAAAVIEDLLTLARRGVPIREVVSLNTMVDNFLTTPECERITAYHNDVRIETKLEISPLHILGSPHHISKTIMNLVSNAAEAMPKGGVITLVTRNQYMDRPLPGYDEIKEGEYAVLSVSDSGEGISSRDIKRIFEPFYTKKVMGRSGTGLGLSVVWGTVKDHGGYIDVQSEKGKGSTFTLYFPITREEKAERLMSPTISEYMGRGESILVVDDVLAQRELASRMLEKLNYHVATVPSGEEAVEYLKNQSVDLVLLDMIMDPGIDGLDTYRKILQIQPGQKAVIVSGFSETDRVTKAQALGAGSYVKKPYVLETIGLAVRVELDKQVRGDTV
ncbi:MAG: response regulator [Syntrophaceae bacterium]|nr:response regulator [Syntrophaceae bacterium]